MTIPEFINAVYNIIDGKLEIKKTEERDESLSRRK